MLARIVNAGNVHFYAERLKILYTLEILTLINLSTLKFLCSISPTTWHHRFFRKLTFQAEHASVSISSLLWKARQSVLTPSDQNQETIKWHRKKWVFLLSFSIYRPFFPNISWHQRGETKETGWQYDRSVPKTQSSLVSRWQLRSCVRTGSKLSLLSLSSGEENLLSKKIQALLSRNWVGSIQKIKIKNIPYKL